MLGRIVPQAGTVAEILRKEGYSTLGVGKWHMVPGYQMTPAGPFDNWPLGKGFERYYGFLGGETDQYSPQMIYDNHIHRVPQTRDYHLSEDLKNQAIQFIADQVSVYPDKPFFMWFGLGAPHSPFQVDEKYMKMYDGVYDKGWDMIRKLRFTRQVLEGIIPAGTKLPASDPAVKPWSTLSAKEKELYVRFMQAYAGFITHADEQIGELVNYLKSIGELDNTMIVLISDNGASPSGGENGLDVFIRSMGGPAITFDELYGQMNKIGGPDFQALYPLGWAQASNTPFREYKQSTFNGGLKEPLIIHWPAGISAKGELRSQYVDIMDITPTVLDVLGVAAPDYINGVKQMDMQGISFAYTFAKADAPSQRTRQFHFMHNSRAILETYPDGVWKAVAVHKMGTPFEEDVWGLYKLDEDYAESNDLAALYPERVKELEALWWSEAKKYNADILVETSPADIAFLQPDSPSNRVEFRYLRGVDTIGWLSDPPATPARPLTTIEIDIHRDNAGQDGVLVAYGGNMGGYTWYIMNNRLVFEYNRLSRVYKMRSSIPVPVGDCALKYTFEYKQGLTGVGTMFINGKSVGSMEINTVPVGLSFEGFDMGRDTLTPVSTAYANKGDFEFKGSFPG